MINNASPPPNKYDKINEAMNFQGLLPNPSSRSCRNGHSSGEKYRQCAVS